MLKHHYIPVCVCQQEILKWIWLIYTKLWSVTCLIGNKTWHQLATDGVIDNSISYQHPPPPQSIFCRGSPPSLPHQCKSQVWKRQIHNNQGMMEDQMVKHFAVGGWWVVWVGCSCTWVLFLKTHRDAGLIKSQLPCWVILCTSSRLTSVIHRSWSPQILRSAADLLSAAVCLRSYSKLIRCLKFLLWKTCTFVIT